MKNLKSTVNTMGQYVTKIIHFSDNSKRTFHGIDTNTIKEGSFVKMKMKDGRMLLINPVNVNCVEIFSEKE